MINRSSGLDTLRYVAACMVIYSHCLNEYDLYGFGGSFVDVFFIISGLVIAKVTEKRFCLTVFLKNRILRIYPSYLIATLLMIVALYVTGNSFQVSELIRSILLFPSFGDEIYYPLLRVGWSLAYEMFFYAAFGLTLFFQQIVERRITVAVMLSVSLILQDIYVFEFLCGIVVYNASKKFNSKHTLPNSLASIAQITGFFGIFGGELLNLLSLPFATPIILISSILIVVGAFNSNYDPRLLAKLGRTASYELYLYHPLVINAISYGLDYANISLLLPVFILVTFGFTHAMVWARRVCIRLPGD